MAVTYTCKFCGKTQERDRIFPNELCQGCYKYFQNGGQVHPVPPRGVIERDDRGYVICHICGRSYKRLGSHIRESHGMTTSEYKEMFGLCANSRTTEREYSEIMRQHAIENGMPERLMTAGFNTRVKAGETHLRKGKQIRLQEAIDKRRRNKG